MIRSVPDRVEVSRAQLRIVLAFSAIGVASAVVLTVFAAGVSPLFLLVPVPAIVVFIGIARAFAGRAEPVPSELAPSSRGQVLRPGVRPTLTEPNQTVTVDEEREVYGIYATLQTLPTSLGLADTLSLVSDRLHHLTPEATVVIYPASSEGGSALLAEGRGPRAEQFTIGSEPAIGGPAEVSIRESRTVAGVVSVDDGRGNTQICPAVAAPLAHEGIAIGAVMLVGEPGSAPTGEAVEQLESVALFSASGLLAALTQREARRSALIDPHMLVPNFRAAVNIPDQRIGASLRHRQGEPIALLCVRFDFDGLTNDELTAICSAIGSGLRQMDILTRGERNELLLILPRAGSGEARLVADRVKVALTDYFHREARICPFALGVASFPRDADTAHDLLKYAQRSLEYGRPAALFTHRATGVVPARA